jgi:hypothetical protein
MASGYGAYGGKHLGHNTIALRSTRIAPAARLTITGVSRCFPFWQEYMACYVINQNDPEARKQGVCVPRLEDYYECLHHKKEVSSRAMHPGKSRD